MPSNQEQIVKRHPVLADFGEFALWSENLDEVLAEACRLVAGALGTIRAEISEIEEERQSLLHAAEQRGPRPDRGTLGARARGA